ncbi:hypothetical protein TNCV_916141 [Trichonephila clavipes]|nr:hypothetical protein TNCV_916141 [Trichonephila clavipes]
MIQKCLCSGHEKKKCGTLMTKWRVEKREGSLGYPGVVTPTFTKDSGHRKMVIERIEEWLNLSWVKVLTFALCGGHDSLVVKVTDSWLACHSEVSWLA